MLDQEAMLLIWHTYCFTDKHGRAQSKHRTKKESENNSQVSRWSADLIKYKEKDMKPKVTCGHIFNKEQMIGIYNHVNEQRYAITLTHESSRFIDAGGWGLIGVQFEVAKQLGVDPDNIFVKPLE
jgi:hypothetical protein